MNASRTFKVLIWGAGYRNKGAEAMMRTVQWELTKRLGTVTWYSFLPREHAGLAFSSGIIPVIFGNDRIAKLVGTGIAGKAMVYNHLLKTRDIKRFCKSLADYRDIWNFVFPRDVDNNIGGFDAVIDVHGFAFGDEWGTSAPRMAREWTRFCRETGKLYFFMPQAWGSFKEDGFAKPLQKMVTEATLYYARDQVSQSHLANILAKPVEEVPLAPDIVLRFGDASRMVGAQILQAAGVDINVRPVIGIAPNMRVFERTKGEGTGNIYVQILAKLCDHCIDILAATVVLIPNELSPVGETHQDDRYLCSLIHATVKKSLSCSVIRDYHSAEEIKSVIGHCDLLIGSRFHALIFALTQSIPVLALGWSHKYRELLSQFGLEEFVCEHGQFDEDNTIALLKKVWKNRESCTKQISSTLPLLLSQVDEVFAKIAKRLNES